MAIRQRLITTANPIQDDLDSLRAANEIHAEAADRVMIRVRPSALAEMRHYPGPAKHPFEFATPKSRAWYFAAIHGKISGVTIPTSGGRYRRSGKLADSMFFEMQDRNDAIELVAGSTSSITKWVLGSFDRQRRYQVPGHRNTGWFLIARTVDYWLDVADEEMKDEVSSVYVEYRSKRQNR